MTEVRQEPRLFEILYTVEGHPKPFNTPAEITTTVRGFAAIVAKTVEIDEPIDVFLEDAVEPLGMELILVDHLSGKFAPIHLARRGKIKTIVEYNLQRIFRDFGPNATIARILRWAVGPEGFNLSAPASDFQFKRNGEVLSLDDHLGQVSGGHKEIALHLVFKVKPQG